MGNCLTSENKVIKIMKIDGKILEYEASIKVKEVLSEFEGHGVSDMVPVRQYLNPNVELVAGRLYFLTPVRTRSPKVGIKKVRFSEPDEVIEEGKQKSSLRIKLVISKQELKDMLENGLISMKGAVSDIQMNELGTVDDMNSKKNCGSNTWTPSLRCIPELD